MIYLSIISDPLPLSGAYCLDTGENRLGLITKDEQYYWIFKAICTILERFA